MDITTATPREIDTILSALYTQRAQAWHAADIALAALHAKVGDRRGRHGFRYSHQQARTLAQEAIDNDTLRPFDRDVVTRAFASLTEQEQIIARVTTQIEPFDAEYDRRQWSRFIVVIANGGHIHSGTRCAGGSIRVTTQLSWRPELSGKTEAEAVAQLGPTLCTHCFPTAPLDWTQGKAEEKADGTCSGSGKGYVSGTWKRNGPSGYGNATCTGCNTTQSTTPSHRVKKHKAPTAK